MKLSKLVDPTFQAALKKLSTQDIPLKSAFKLKGVIKQVNEALTNYENVRVDALKRFGEKNDSGDLVVGEGGSVKLSEDNAAGFVKELNELLNSDIDVGSVKVSELGDKLSIGTTELMALEDLLVD